MSTTDFTLLPWRAYAAFWCGALVLLFAFVWLFNPILLPFVVGVAVAYLLEPVVLRLVRSGLSRRIAIILILGLFLAVIVLAFSILLPLLTREMTMLADALPDLAARLRTMIEAQRDHLRPYIGDIAIEDVMTAISGNAGHSLNVGREMLVGVLSGGRAAIEMIIFVALMPIVAFYMMMEWPNMVMVVDELLPRKSAAVIRDMLHELNGKIAGFVRGQLIVCLILAIFYGIGLTAVGVDYGFLIGVIGGILSIIPFIGSLTALGGTIIMGLLQVQGDGWVVLLSGLAVLGIGHFIEAHFIAPRIVGDSVGLHPLWVIFALLAGASLGGLLGMFVAVPVAAAVAVLISFGLRQYKQSPYYHEGLPHKPAGTSQV